MTERLAGHQPRFGLSSPELLLGCCAVFIGLGLGWVLMRPTTTQSSGPRASGPKTSESAAPQTAVHSNAPVPSDTDSEAGGTNVDVVLQEIRRLRQEVTSLRESQDPQALVSVNATTTVSRPVPAQRTVRSRQQTVVKAASDREVGQRTFRYWNKLNEIMASEEAMRKAPTKGLTVANVGDFLSRRGQAGGFAAQAIRKLDTENVDAAVVAQGLDIASWYDHGNRLNDTAKNLFQNSATHERSGQPGQQWGDAEKAHGQSVSDLNRRGDELRREMIAKYSLPFPDLR